MTRQGLVLLLVLATSAGARAQAPWAEKLFKDGVTHDFGTVPRGAQLVHRFTVHNIYAVKLQLTEIRTSCGCVTVTPSSKVIEPRGKVTLEMLMDTRRFSGQKSVTVHVSVGPEYISTAELKLSANIRSDVVFNPGQLSFGVVSAGAEPSETVDVEYAGSLDWKVTEAVADGAPVELTVKELYRRQGQVGYQVKATLKKDAPPGSVRQPILLKTNDPATPTVAILVEANVQATLAVSPGSLRLGAVKPGQEVTRKITIQGKTPFRVTDIDGMGEGVSLASELPAKAALVQVLSFRCQLTKEGDFRRQLHIKTDLQDAPVTFTIDATVVP